MLLSFRIAFFATPRFQMGTALNPGVSCCFVGGSKGQNILRKQLVEMSVAGVASFLQLTGNKSDVSCSSLPGTSRILLDEDVEVECEFEVGRVEGIRPQQTVIRYSVEQEADLVDLNILRCHFALMRLIDNQISYQPVRIEPATSTSQ